MSKIVYGLVCKRQFRCRPDLRLAIIVCAVSLAGSVFGENLRKDLTHYSRPGTVITNDPIRSYGLDEADAKIIKEKGLLITEKISYSSFGEAY